MNKTIKEAYIRGMTKEQKACIEIMCNNGNPHEMFCFGGKRLGLCDNARKEMRKKP